MCFHKTSILYDRGWVGCGKKVEKNFHLERGRRKKINHIMRRMKLIKSIIHKKPLSLREIYVYINVRGNVYDIWRGRGGEKSR
jgi:hypothetical protein